MKPIAFVVIAALASCTAHAPSLLGKWQCDDAAGSGPYIWDFGNNVLVAEFQGETAECAYSIDWRKAPHWLDIQHGDDEYHCIIEFIDTKSVRVAGLGIRQARPTEFTDDHHTLVFQKIE